MVGTEKLQSAEMAQTEHHRDYLQGAVLGALNIMMVDTICRDRVLPVDPGILTIIKLARELQG